MFFISFYSRAFIVNVVFLKAPEQGSKFILAVGLWALYQAARELPVLL